jgi:TRAP transporter TAXI family solute receptor
MHARKRDWKDGLTIYGPAALLVLVAFAVAFQFIKPAPPKHLTLAAGMPGGAYHAYAERYRAILAREGITVAILDTAGAVENLELLRTQRAQVGFVQGGVAPASDTTDFTALGSLYFEPLWLFHRAGLSLDRLPALRGLRVAVGASGSGTRALTLELLADNGITGDNSRLLALGGTEAAAALAAGEVDAAFLVAAPTAPLVAELLQRPGVALASLERAEAYARRYRYLSNLTLPEGAVDLTRNIPPRAVRLLAPTAGLVASPALHPALVDLLLLAAREVHGQGGWFAAVGQFPSAEFLAFPLNQEAGRFYEHGPPLLQRYLPVWAASLVDRLKVMLLPLLVLLLPLLKVMPPIYSWRMRSRVYRWYRELDLVDAALRETPDAASRSRALAELDRIESDVRRVEVPLSFAGQLYHLREHIDLMRQRVRAG